jgi:outer membrane protein assembly factor BamB
MTSSARKFFVLSLCVPLAGTGLSAQDWPQWRGALRTGEAAAFKAPAEWPEELTRAWSIDAGEGHSSPVVSGGRVFVMSRIGEQEGVTAYDLSTGKQVWRQLHDAPYTMSPAARGHGKGPKSTALVHGGRVYGLGIAGALTAYGEETGKVAWRREFQKEYPLTSPEFGAAMSPIFVDGLLVAHVGGERGGALAAFDAATGETRWALENDGPAYASPIVAEFDGVRQIVTQTQSNLVGVAPKDGQLLWNLRFTTDYDQNSVTPLVAGGLLVYGGLNTPTTAVRVGRTAGKWTTTEVWRNADVPMYMSTPVLAAGVIVGLTHRNRGQFFAIDPLTGRTLWTSPGRQGENAALLTTGTVVLAVTTDSQLTVIRADPKAYAEVRRYTIAKSPVWAHPAPAGNGFVIKDRNTLSYWTF